MGKEEGKERRGGMGKGIGVGDGGWGREGTYGIVFGAGGEDVAAEGVVPGGGGGEEGV